MSCLRESGWVMSVLCEVGRVGQECLVWDRVGGT